MDREDVLDLMASVGRRVKKRTKDTIRDVIRLAEAYRHLGGKFSFDADADLEKQAKELLVKLSDLLLEDARDWAEKTAEDDDDGIAIAWGLRDRDGLTELERIDRHNSFLYYSVQAWIALGFANGLSEASILGNILAFPDPRKSSLSKKSVIDYSYLSDPEWGSGFIRDSIKGNTVIIQDIINSTYQRGVLERYGRNPKIIGYKVHRGSTYQCGLCDEMCVGIHPLDEIVLPAHPRCCCWTTPVYEKDI